ncbi:hypothetical protein [Streptococcus dysgalactiae]|nr:hypothetical protein [Streptococcus dysgalactiae]
MKKIYSIVLLSFLAMFFFYMNQLIRESHHLSLPGARASIEVVDWDKKYSTTQIYKTLEQFTKENKIGIYKVSFGTSAVGKPEKTIFTFPSQQSKKLKEELPKENIRGSDKLSIENPIGSYYLQGAIPEKLIQKFHHLGLKTAVETNFLKQFFLQFLSGELAYVLVFLIFILFIVDLFVYFSESKKIGIFRLHGENPYQLVRQSIRVDLLALGFFIISCFNLPREWMVFAILTFFILLFLLISHLVALSIAIRLSSIVEQIKSKKPFKKLVVLNILIKVILVVFCSATLLYGIKDLVSQRELEKNLMHWENLPNVARLYFSSNTRLIPGQFDEQKEKNERDQKSRKVIYDLLTLAEEEGGILAESYSLREYKIAGKTVPGHNYMVVNHHFLEHVSVLANQGEKIGNLAPNMFHLIIPENLKKYDEQIKAMIMEVIAFHKDVKSPLESLQSYPINIIYSKKEQKVFNYNTINFHDTTTFNPVILVAKPTLFGEKSDFLVADVSQGNYLFNNPLTAATYIKDHGLVEDFAGLTSGRELALRELNIIRSRISLKVLSMITSILAFIIINYFLLMTYIESQRKKIVVWLIFGKSFWERHGLFLLSMIGLTLLAFTVVFLLQLTTFPIILGLMTLDAFIYTGLLLMCENKECLATIKKGN